MAVPPTIPTSFVPKQPVKAAPARKKKSGGGGFFLSLSFFILIVAVIGSGGVFGYQYYLEGVIERKNAQVAAAEESIQQSVVEEFVKLRDRFAIGQELLDNHVALSQFFDVLERTTLQNVRFSTLSYSFSSVDGTSAPRALVSMTGVARTFNALAAQSGALSREPNVRNAIFSNITVNPNGSVSFDLRAEIAPALLTLAEGGGGAPAPTAPPASSGATVPEPQIPGTVGTTTPPDTTTSEEPAAEPAESEGSGTPTGSEPETATTTPTL